MENETDLIRQQMLETRTSLSEKLEALEEKVLHTVEGTSKTVTDTVHTVQDAVQDVTSTVSETVQDTVESVKHTLDLSEQVENHPWLMLGGAVALGYLGGRLLESNGVGGLPSATSNNGLSAGFVPAAPPTQSSSHLSSWLSASAGPVIEKVRDLALGALAGVAVDMIRKNVPPDFQPHLEDLTNTITTSLGVKPLHGLVSNGNPQKTTLT